MSWPRGRSRSGWRAMRDSISTATSAWRPRASSASMRSSVSDELQLLQPAGLGRGEGLGELGERRAPPQGEGLGEALGRRGRVSLGEGLAPAAQQLLRAEGVNLLGGDVELVPRRARDQHPRRQHLPQLGDVDLDHLGRRVRRLLAPEVVDQPRGRHGPPGAEREHGEERPLLAASEGDGVAAVEDLEGPQGPDLHLPRQA